MQLSVTAAADLGDGASGVVVVSAQGARAARIPWAIAPRPQDGLVDSVSLSNWEFDPSKTAPAVLAFRAGRAVVGPGGEQIEPVGLLDVELWTPKGKRIGVIARLRDLLPGRYAFGLTGRGPDGKELAPGTYVLRLRAQPVDEQGEMWPVLLHGSERQQDHDARVASQACDLPIGALAEVDHGPRRLTARRGASRGSPAGAG